METETALMTIILPVTYIICDLLKPVPKVPNWALPMIAAATGAALGVAWAYGVGHTATEALMIHGVVGFSFGAGATGMNQVKRQSEER